MGSSPKKGASMDVVPIRWQRKHYSWPDLPKGYQLTLSGSGSTPIGVGGSFMGIGITQVHLEEDPAAWDPETGCVDYNRSGVPLLEIVTEPEFSTAEEVQAWLAALVHGLRYLGVLDVEAGVKADVNVSIPGKHDRVEVKNVHSVKEIGSAIDYELERQGKKAAGSAAQLSVGETRRFDASSGKTAVMRSKEGADDYRFIVDPDLLGLVLKKEFVADLEKGMPETPEEKLKKLVGKYRLGKQDAAVLAKHLEVVEFYEGVVSSGLKPGFVLPWVTGELLRVLHYSGHELGAVDIQVEHFAALLKLVHDGKITETQAKKTLNDFVPKSFDPAKKVGKKMSGRGELGKIVDAVLKGNGKAVEDYRSGNKGALHFLVGQVMAKTKGAADVSVVRVLLENLLK
jgi:aspartyl-tRNA(Asn)/glutamyl-tRNA(Gln) amidotransferase subunit B